MWHLSRKSVYYINMNADIAHVVKHMIEVPSNRAPRTDIPFLNFMQTF